MDKNTKNTKTNDKQRERARAIRRALRDAGEGCSVSREPLAKKVGLKSAEIPATIKWMRRHGENPYKPEDSYKSFPVATINGYCLTDDIEKHAQYVVQRELVLESQTKTLDEYKRILDLSGIDWREIADSLIEEIKASANPENEPDYQDKDTSWIFED